MAAKKKTAKKAAPKKKFSAAKGGKKSASSKSAKKAPAKKFGSKAGGKFSGKTSGKSGGKKVGGKRPVRKTKRPSSARKAPARAKAPRAPKVEAAAAPEALALARTIAAVASEKKADDILIIDCRSRSSSVGYDYVVLASGESDRQLAAIHEGVEQLLKPQGKLAASVEASPDWVCVTYDQGVVAHFFTPDKREMMDLEGLWKDASRVSASA